MTKKFRRSSVIRDGPWSELYSWHMCGISWKEQRERKYQGVNNHIGGSHISPRSVILRKPMWGEIDFDIRKIRKKLIKFQNWRFLTFSVFFSFFFSFSEFSDVWLNLTLPGSTLTSPLSVGVGVGVGLVNDLSFRVKNKIDYGTFQVCFFPKTSNEYEVKWIWHGPFYILTHPPSPILKRKTDLSVCPYLLTKDQCRW